MLYFFNIVLYSVYSYGGESISFPVSTEINKALLSNFTISSALNRDFIPLIYDNDSERFRDEEVSIIVKTNIHESVNENYSYKYTIENLESSCSINSVKLYQDVIDLYINNEKFISNEILSDKSFAFSELDSNNLKQNTDIFTLKTNRKIPRSKPVFCTGHVDYVIELFL
ncbi:hypothetical protein [Photobacterium damselae]|uniref:hypothetical protein n=1 Tax=Photobacterium damselae TaxID=38293 RepID=UPI0035A94F8D